MDHDLENMENLQPKVAFKILLSKQKKSMQIKKFWRHDRLPLGLGSLVTNTMEEKKAR